MVNAGIVDIVEDSVANCEPHVALVTKRCTEPAFEPDVQRAGLPLPQGDEMLSMVS